MRDFMTEIKTINAAEALAQQVKEMIFTKRDYDELQKYHNLPSLAFVRKHGIIKVVKSEDFAIVREGKTINAKRYFYAIDANRYDEIMAFMHTRTGLKKFIKRCGMRMSENTAKMKMLADRNAEMETFLELVGQW